MVFEKNNKIKGETIIDSILSILPIPFALWVENNDFVFVSEILRKKLALGEKEVDSIEFVKAFNKVFGNFLYEASKKILSGSSFHESFKSEITDINGNTLPAELSFNKKSNMYLLFIGNYATEQEETYNSEAQDLKIILDALPIYIWKRNRDLKITFCNKKYSEAIGDPQEKIIKENIRLAEAKKDGTNIEQIALFSGKKQIITEKIIIKGERRSVEITEDPQSRRNFSIGYALDITNLEKAKKEYEDYKFQTDEILNYVPVPIVMFEASTKLAYANKAAMDLFGMGESFVFSQPEFSNIIDFLRDNKKIMETEDYQELKKELIHMFKSILSPYRTLFHMPNGKDFNMLIYPNKHGELIVIFEDITDKIALERKINSFSVIQREAFDHLYEGVIVFGVDNRIRILNPSARDLWKKKEEEKWEGCHIKDFFEGSDALFDSLEKKDAFISEIINMETKRECASNFILLKDKTHIDFAYIPLPEGLNLIRFVDSTNEKKLEKMIAEQAESLLEIDKLKSNIISSVTYELRSPISTIVGFSDILINQYFGELNEKQLDYCKGILSSVNVLSEIIDAMINLASIEAGQMKIKYSDVNLFDFIKEVTNLFKEQRKAEKTSFKIQMDNKDLAVSIDTDSMKQVLFQIISKYMKNSEQETEITISATQLDNQVDYFEISIINNENKIPQIEINTMQKIFMSNIDDKNININVEFCMKLANSIVRLHNGKISIQNTEDGSVIKIVMPFRPFFI